MFATSAAPAIAVIMPARLDSPRPPAMTRSTSGPRPNTRLVPSGIPITRPDGVVTCTWVTTESTAISRLSWPYIRNPPSGRFPARPLSTHQAGSAGHRHEHGVARILGRLAAAGIPDFGDGFLSRFAISYSQPRGAGRTGALVGGGTAGGDVGSHATQAWACWRARSALA